VRYNIRVVHDDDVITWGTEQIKVMVRVQRLGRGEMRGRVGMGGFLGSKHAYVYWGHWVQIRHEGRLVTKCSVTQYQ